MESVRVRGCVIRTGARAHHPGRQADASRRRNGPRKAGDSRSRCGLEVSPASAPPSDTAIRRERAGSGIQAAKAPAGDCGDEDQVGRAGSISPCQTECRSERAVSSPATRRFTWMLWSPDDTSRCQSRFREHVSEKLARLEKHDHRIIRVQVEVEEEKNPRQHDRAIKIELTAFSKGPVIRAEAAAEDKMGALDLALDKMAAQMRRAADRRRVHRGRHTPRLGRTGPGRQRRRHPGHRRRRRRDRHRTPGRTRSPSPVTARSSCARSRTRPRR